MTGTSVTTFDPDLATTRGMIVSILHRLEGQPVASPATSFADVAADQYYAQPIGWASSNNIISGYDGQTFGPADPITREQLAAILHRYASYKGLATQQQADLTSYRDHTAISDYARGAVAWANATGLLTGTSQDTLSPTDGATRAQVATMMMRFQQSLSK